jgi:elongation factor G
MLRDTALGLHRNVGIIAHIDAGKTTCTERILLFTGAIHRSGEVHHGDTELDFLPQEREMGITISSAATSVAWTPTAGTLAGKRISISLIDTPGHVDFTIEVERSLRVLDGAVALFDARNGVEPQSETVWRQADRHGVPRLVFINKMDKLGASFAGAVASIRARLGAVVVPVQIPVGEEAAHRGVIDLVRMRAALFDDPTGATFVDAPIPDELVADAALARAELVEACADLDDAVLEKFVAGRAFEITASEIERALRAGVCSRRIAVVLCGSAHKNKGIQQLLDAVCAYLPSPREAAMERAVEVSTSKEIGLAADDDGPLAALAFKVMSLDRTGSVTLLRIYSGRVRAGALIHNARTGTVERIGRLVFMRGAKVVDADSAGAGEIAAVIGLKLARTGDTLSDPRRPLALAGLEVPEAVVELAIEPCTAADQERLSRALARLALEDPSFRVIADAETGQTRIAGMGELHLTILVDKLKREHRVEVATGRPHVAYKETLGQTARGEHKLSKQNGGPGQYAHVILEVGPGAPGKGLVFEDRSRGGSIPREFLPAIEQGVQGALGRGVVAGYPVVDVEVRLLDGGFHAVDSRPAAFEVAASMAFRKAAEMADPRLLEPIMKVEITAPEEHFGEVLADLHGRRGEVLSVIQLGGDRIVTALVPLRALFGHTGDLRSRTQGRASASMRLAHHARVPAAVEAGLRAAQPK